MKALLKVVTSPQFLGAVAGVAASAAALVGIGVADAAIKRRRLRRAFEAVQAAAEVRP